MDAVNKTKSGLATLFGKKSGTNPPGQKTRERRPSKQTLSVLACMIEYLEKKDGTDELLTGYRINQETGLASGVIYPILSRLEDEGIVGSEEFRREDGEKRRNFFLTEKGLRYAHKYFRLEYMRLARA